MTGCRRICGSSWRITVLSIFFLAGYSSGAFAQTYPVQVITQLSPPYSVKLSDYTAATTDRIAVNVFADIARPELQVKFRLRIEGQNVTVTTRPEYNPLPVTIRGGMPERFTGYDLAEYFNPANLTFQGITRQQFMKTGSLPEGFYRFQIEVLEYNRGTQISNTGAANAWLILNDPPIINLPRQDEKLKPQSPQNVLIQWTPRHTGSPNSAFATEYEVKMVEVWPAGRNPNDAILSSPTIFETTTQSTTIIYGPAETPLELGRRYAFRVRAKSMVGVDEMDLFKNNGYSEVVSFVYGDACDLPTGIRAESLNSTRFNLTWDGQLNHTAYKVRYRLAGDNTAQWFENNLVINEASITSLKANTKYEYQVAGVCGLFDGPYSTVATVTTKEAPPIEYSCGLPMETFNLDPASLVASLKVGDVIQAGDFDVELVKVSGSNGAFSGEGIIEVPFFNNAKANVTFSNIFVNKDLRMVRGNMNVTGAGVNVVPDAVLAGMNELSETLDEIDGVLNDAEEALDKIDEVLSIADQVVKDAMKYLPDDIVQDINTSRAQITNARNEMKASTTPEEKEQAKANVKEAKKKLKDSVVKAAEYYGKAVARFASILWKVIVELKQEVVPGDKKSEEEYLAARRELEAEIYERQGFSRQETLVDTSFIFIASLSEEFEGEPDNEQMKAFAQKVSEFTEAQRTRFFVKTMLAFFAFYMSENVVQDQFIKDATINGKAIVDTVLTQMKEGKSDDEIKNSLKDKIKSTIQELADHLLYAEQ